LNATNPQAKSRKRKPLRDVQPIARHAHQDSTLVLGDRLASPEFRKRYELLKTTVRRVILRGRLFTLMPDDKPSALLNGLIEQATGEGLALLREPATATDWTNGSPAFSDAEVVRAAKCIADKIVKAQKVITRKCKRDDAGNPILKDGKTVRGYQCVGLRIEHPIRNQDENPDQPWTSPVDSFVVGMDGHTINGGRTTNYSQVGTQAMVSRFQRQMLHEVLEKYLGEDADFLIDYLAGRYDSPVADEMAACLIECLKPHRDELEQFRDLLT
jgi:hypothetical protein